MKKTILIMVVALLGAVTMSAQGNWYAGGSLGFWNNDDTDATTFSIAPEVGYNLNSNWAVGAELGFDYLKVGDNNTNVFAIAPYARYTYFKESKFSLFVDGGFGVAKAKDLDASWNVGFKPGFAVNLTDKFALVSKFGFLGYQDAGELDLMHGFGFNFTNNVSFGFYVNF